MKKGIRKVVLVGDMPTKVEFISQFLNENLKVSLKELCRDGAPLVEVSHADNFEENIITDKTKTNISVLSVAFPDGILLSVDLSETDWISCKNLQDTELILFVEGFPFATDTLIDRIVLIEKFLMTETRRKSFKSVQFRVVFFKNKNQHFGDTDIVDINKALKYAPDCVTKGIDKNNKCMFPINSLLDFKIYEDVDDCIDVVSCKMKTLKILTAVGEKQLNLWRSELEYYFEDYRQEYDYQFSDALRFETIHNNVNKFAVVKGSNDIMERYAENYFKKCFDEVKKIALEQYQRNIRDVCFWNIDKDISTLSEILDKLCKKALIFKEHFVCPKLQADYQAVLTKEKIDIKFSNKVKSLEQEEVPKRVYQYLKKKEEILFGVFDE